MEHWDICETLLHYIEYGGLLGEGFNSDARLPKQDNTNTNIPLMEVEPTIPV
jgi:hypothetical protein